MADTNGTGHKPPVAWTETEREVLRLLPGCSAAFLGWLKVEAIGRIQREKMGVRGDGEVGRSAVQRNDV